MEANDRRRKDAEDDEEGGGSSDEEGIDLMNSEGDSSEEDEDDPEEEAKIREGFIADDDDEGARRRRKKKKRKLREREYEALSEDDLDLVEQNTGVRIERPEGRKLKKLKRAGAASDDSDEEDEEDLANLFDDSRARSKSKGKKRADADTNLLAKANRAIEMDEVEDDMADFIEEDSPDEGDDEMREARAKRKRQEKAARRQKSTGFSLGGLDINAEAWDEIQEIFGDGHDYDEALESDDEETKPKPTIQDVFEPSEIAERMMTSADDIIRSTDIPERMQIAQAGVSARQFGENEKGEPLMSDLLLELNELDAAAQWVSTRISDRLTDEFIYGKDAYTNGPPALREPFLKAVRDVLQFLACDYFEVPFIWVHRRDYFIHHNPNALNPQERSRSFFTREHLWKMHSLAIKFRAILDRKANLLKLWQKIAVEDQYFTEAFEAIDSLEEAADLVDFVSLKYQSRLRDMAEQAGAGLIPEDAEADAIRNGPSGLKYKRATSSSNFERAKNSLVARFAEQIALPAETLAQDFITGAKQHYLDDPPSNPEQYAYQYTDPQSAFVDASSVIAGAKTILTTEIGKEPSLRKEIRRTFRNYGAISIRPTDKGAQKIDDMHPYYAFKYLLDKPLDQFRSAGQFLEILEAEAEGLVIVDIHVLKKPLHKLTQEFYSIYLSDLTSDDARSWNRIREDIVMDALQSHLLPLGARWARDWLKEKEQEDVAERCASKLEELVGVTPFQIEGKNRGDVPRVMAITHGHGDVRKDFVYAVCLNSRGRLIDHERFEDLKFMDTKERLREHVARLKPEVIVIGGFSPATHNLWHEVAITIGHPPPAAPIPGEKEGLQLPTNLYCTSSSLGDGEGEAVRLTPVIWAYDDVARLYQNSKRGVTEFGEITRTARYGIALARYVQSPLCEYASLGQDLTSVTFDKHQRFVPKEKLLAALEHTIANVVNLTGVDINRAVRDSYYGSLLPYVAGLGPRKANGIVKRINIVNDGTLVCRADLVKKDITTSRIFMNCVAFLRIPREGMEEEDEYDILDSTRIHSEDYHIARKMAADAEEMDEEDIEDLAHPSAVVAQLMDDGGASKLDELNLDDFAAALLETQGLRKRIALYQIRDELQRPFKENRSDFKRPSLEEVFYMLTGESDKTMYPGAVVPVQVQRELKGSSWLCRLDSGIIGVAATGLTDPDVQYRFGQVLQAQILQIHYERLRVELSLVQVSQEDDLYHRRTKPDRYYNTEQAEMDKQAYEAKNKRKEGRQRRVVNHPNFQNFNAGQAEQYLANLQRGDCVVRTSSRGNDHLAVTWKVDDGVYQHIDVLELDKPNEFSLGRQLRIQNKYTYSDLDELIVSHVRAMARKVDEMMHSDKYKGSEADLRKWLTTSIMAEPTRSFYGFALDTRKPGNFVLSFLTKGYDIQTWGVTVEPDAFILQGNMDPAPNVTMLCNAFKSTYVTKMALAGGNAAGLAARTPYLGGRTPNPYAGGMTPRAGGMTPHGARSPYVQGGQSRPAPGPYMNPARMAQAGFNQHR